MKTLILPAKLLRLLAFALAFFLLFWLISSLSPSRVHGQECTATSGSAEDAINAVNKCAISKDVFDDKVFNLNQLTGTIDSAYSLLFGVSGLHPQLSSVLRNQSALAFSGSLIASLYRSPPASGVHYMAGLIDQANPVKSAYAEAPGGIGFDTLRPVQNMWKAFRNLSYVGFVIVFVITGFMIMFRAHISPQAVATVQDSIPRIVVALFLVTFSYAIAGFMIDLMFLFINIAINVIPGINPSGAQNIFQKSFLQIIIGNWTDVFKIVASAVSSVINSTITFGGFFLSGLQDLIGGLGGMIGGLVVGIALLYVMFRVFLMLLSAYVMIIVLTLGAPFFFLIQALPGNNSAKSWFQQMASQVSVFLTVSVMLLFAAALGGLGDLGGSGTAALSSTIRSFPLLTGGFDANAIGKLIAVGFILMTPEAANIVRNALGVKGQAGFGGAGAAVLGAGLGAVQMAGGRAGRGLYEQSPLGGYFRANQARRQEEAMAEGKARAYTAAGGKNPPTTKLQKLEQFGLGYKKNP